jgi:pimeloyl-ACP methyl ester carboxylesterase
MTSHLAVDQQVGQVKSPDGTAIAYWRAGAGPPLVLVHGTTADHTRWTPVLPALAQRFTTYAVDRRGRGASGDAPAYAIEREYEDVAAVIDSLPAGVNLLGHSYGAICSLEAALLSGRAERLVLYEPPLGGDIEIYDPTVVRRMEQLLEAGDREGVVTTMMLDVVRVPPAQLDLLRSLPAWQARVASAHTIVRELQASEETGRDLDRFRRLTTPTLLLLGGESPPFFRTAIERLAQVLPNARVAVMPGQHHTAIDTGTEIFLKEVLGFLTEVRPTSGL